MIIRPHTILKNEKENVPRIFRFFDMVWGDRFIISPSEIYAEKVPLSSAVVIMIIFVRMKIDYYEDSPV